MGMIFKIMAVTLNEWKRYSRWLYNGISLIFKMDAWRPENRSNCKNEKNVREYYPHT
jgi:hypothetical protein